MCRIVICRTKTLTRRITYSPSIFEVISWFAILITKLRDIRIVGDGQGTLRIVKATSPRSEQNQNNYREGKRKTYGSISRPHDESKALYKSLLCYNTVVLEFRGKSKTSVLFRLPMTVNKR